VINDVESELTRLPEPVPPATLATAVMARVSGLAEARQPAALVSPVPALSAREARAWRWRDLPAPFAATAGLFIVIISWTVGWLDAGSWLAIVSPGIGAPPLVRIPHGAPAAPALALGLLLYVAGLFAPVRRRQ
jgi:hypothetical protein